MAEWPMEGRTYVLPDRMQVTAAVESVTVLADGRVVLDGTLFSREETRRWLAGTRAYWSGLGDMLRWLDSLGLVGTEIEETGES